MQCHNLASHLNIPQDAKKVVLVGNPNVGKSVFFNAFTGMYADVSNYPGTTLEITYGKMGEYVVMDTPGVYGVSSFNDEEVVARDVILSADVIVNVVDAVHMERDLFLTQQVIDMGIPTVVALNMIDEAQRHGIEVDVDLLSDLLGVPVVPTIAVTKHGFEEVKAAIPKARVGRVDPELLQELQQMLTRVGTLSEALLVLEGDPYVAQRHGIPPGNQREAIYSKRRHKVNDIIGHVVKEISHNTSFSTRLGRWMLKPITGIPILAFTLWLIYQFIGVFVAQTVVGITEEAIMQEMYEPAVFDLVGRFINPETVLGELLIGEFGVLTMTVTYLLGLLLPLVIGFYLTLSVLEDSGYLPRIAVLVDRLLTGIGLNGRGVIPIILGFGCVTMATITTRMLGSDRERRIATFLLALTIPCSAQLAVIMAMLADEGGKYIAIYAGTIFGVLVIVGSILHKLLPGQSSDLLIDLPPIRLPRLDNVIKKTVTKSVHFMKEATPLFAIGALLIGSLQVSGLLSRFQAALAPLTEGWLQLPREAAAAFIMGFVRRDFGAAGLYDLPLTPEQKVVALVTISLFVPCIASALVIFKERGRKEALLIWPSVLVLAFVIGGLLSRLLV
ncbi:MAG: ferrous iron transport protein B [Bacillota bacterium]